MNDRDSGKSESKTLWETIVCGPGTAQDKKNQYRFILFTLFWAICFIGASFVFKQDYDLSTPVAYAIALVPTAAGICALLAYMKFLREADEMIRKMQFEGLAFGFGIGVIFTLCYQVFESAGAPHLEIDDAAFVMMMGWIAGQILAFRRYQ